MSEAATPPPTGLSEAEASARRAAGQGNDVSLGTGRTYAQIVRDNVFNVINNLLFALGVTLIALGRWLDAVVAVGVVMANTVVSLFQEIRAKRTLDRIAILTRPRAVVLRDAVEREIDPAELVLGDLIVVHAGDQIVVDGRLAAGGPLEVDESLLTGESDLVPKRPGAELLSGSFVNSGGGSYLAERVGAESFANRITSQAQAHRRVLTPLQRQVTVIIRILLGLVVVFEALVIIKSIIGSVPFVETVRMSTVIVALIPNGLILAIALSYALGAVRMAGKGTLIQQANAVESLSHVDVLCTDKTGTLTTNAIRFQALEPLEATEDEMGTLLGAFAAGVTEANKTALALAEAFPGAGAAGAAGEPAATAAPLATPSDEALFSSKRKWSGLTYDSGPARGTLVLGAPEVIAAALADGPARERVLSDARLAEWTARGLRVLLLARRSEPLPFPRPDGHPALPDLLVPLGLVCLRDELRENVQETLAEFSQAGIAIKVISGDNPDTVAALAAQAGLAERPDRVSGGELAAMDEAAFAQAAAETQVFGRVTPEQKESLAGALRDRGHYVAMIGDGVNDVIALKRANLGIAMQGGSQAARAVADMILMKDSFAALPAAFSEGQRIRNGMIDVLRIFMVRIFSKAALIAVMLPLGGFPFAPRNSSLLSFLGAGIPVLGLTIWAIPGRPLVGSIYRPLVRFALPPTLLMAALGLPLHLWVRRHYENAYANAGAADTPLLDLLKPFSDSAALDYALPYAQTATIVFMILCSLLLLPFTVPPTRFFADGAPLRGDRRPTWLALGLAGALVLNLSFPLTRTIWELTALPLWLYAACVGLTVVWGLLVKGIWRSGVLDRLLKIPKAPARPEERPTGQITATKEVRSA